MNPLFKHVIFSKYGPVGGAYPWVNFDAIFFLKNLVHEDMKIFEYGSGGSTIFFAKRTREVISVENDRGFYESMLDWMRQRGVNNCKLNYVPPDIQAAAQYRGPDETGAYISEYRLSKGKSFLSYAEFIDSYEDAFFDFVFVDGRGRVGCVYHALRKVKPGGYLALDDAQRKRYDPARNALIAAGWKEIKVCWGCCPWKLTVEKTGFWKRSTL